MNSLTAAPQPLTLLQRRLAWLATTAVAFTRIWARSATLWDWDEAQFASALREYDVVAHQPHPPGFPLFVGLAKALHFAVSDFHALQVIVVLSACALFPLLFLLARELRFPFATAFSGSLLFVFFPNVWFFGGTAFSDVPGLALLVAACVLLLRGCRESRSYFAGALVLGLAAAIRPQALLVACAPALIASWHRVRRSSILALVCASAIGASVIVVSYACAALASRSVQEYFVVVRQLRDYVRQVDSFLSPIRPPLGDLWPQFFLSPTPGGNLPGIVAWLAGAAVVLAVVIPIARRGSREGDERLPAWWSVWLLLLMFLPFNVFGFLMLDIHSISRYSIGYAAMYALLAAQAISWLATPLRRAAPFVAIVVVTLLAAKFARWAAPAIREVRKDASPTVAAMRWVRANTAADAHVYVHDSMGPFSRLFLADRMTTQYDSPRELELAAAGAGEWLAREGTVNCISAQHFLRERGRLFEMVRERYFEVTIMPRGCLIEQGNGWYDEEWVGGTAWRWMGGRSETRLSPVPSPASLRLQMTVPHELLPRRPVITISLNGAVVDRWTASTDTFDRTWTVTPRAEGWNDLTIEIDKVLNPKKEGLSEDVRDLGLQLTGYEWK